MQNKDIFKELFILDMANNHQGDVRHAVKIINDFSKIILNNKINGIIKLQFRNLETYIHKNYINSEEKFIKRFNSTKLSLLDYKKILSVMKKNNLKTMSTPFDEESVNLIDQLNIDIIKIASVSANEKILIKRAEKSNKPMIISVGGKNIEEIDWLVNYLEMKNALFAIQHCVAIYPTKDKDLDLNQIDFLKKRYPNVPVGFSTHENPDNLDPIKIAAAKNSNLFERHIGIETKKYKLNDYSSNPEQIDKWFKSYKKTKIILGGKLRKPSSNQESETLNKLSRGVYAKKNLNKESILDTQNTYFSFPLLKGQISSSDYLEFCIQLKSIIKRDNPIKLKDIVYKKIEDNELIISNFMLQFKSMIKISNCAINDDAEIEISHHFGIDRFREFGCLIITCFNYQYAKKLILLLPRQKHPYHYHKKKTENFQILFGKMEAEISGNRVKLKAGDYCTVKTNEWHKFHTTNGVIFEEISTKHYNDDSFYKDKKIINQKRDERKTNLNHWIQYFKSVK